MKRWWRKIRRVPGDRREHGAGRGGGRFRRLWLLEKIAAEQKRTYRELGKFIMPWVSRASYFFCRSKDQRDKILVSGN